MNRKEQALRSVFGAVLIGRLLYPFFNSPLDHLFSDPLRHWENAKHFLHPTITGSSDPYLYQLWLFLAQQASGDSGPWLQLHNGLLCAVMPYGWYRALRELLPRDYALSGAIIIGLTPSLIGIYGYFMTETLLLCLMGFASWSTLRARRKRTTSSTLLAIAAWTAVGFTRVAIWPVAAICITWGILLLAKPWRAAMGGVCIISVLAIPASLHAHAQLGFYSPFGNLYLHEIYRHSGNKTIDLDFGPHGHYSFGSPSYFNATFYPFSDWTTARKGTVAVDIDTHRGRTDWLAQDASSTEHRQFSKWTDFLENAAYVSWGQSWPDNDRTSIVGWASVWTRWFWMPLLLTVLAGLVFGRLQGDDFLLSLCALSMYLFLILQQQGITEGRFRKPLEPFLLAAAIVLIYRLRIDRRSIAPPTWPPKPMM